MNEPVQESARGEHWLGLGKRGMWQGCHACCQGLKE